MHTPCVAICSEKLFWFHLIGPLGALLLFHNVNQAAVFWFFLQAHHRIDVLVVINKVKGLGSTILILLNNSDGRKNCLFVKERLRGTVTHTRSVIILGDPSFLNVVAGFGI